MQLLNELRKNFTTAAIPFVSHALESRLRFGYQENRFYTLRPISAQQRKPN
jgi:hypothetical protein